MPVYLAMVLVLVALPAGAVLGRILLGTFSRWCSICGNSVGHVCRPCLNRAERERAAGTDRGDLRRADAEPVRVTPLGALA